MTVLELLFYMYVTGAVAYGLGEVMCWHQPTLFVTFLQSFLSSYTIPVHRQDLT